MKYLFLVIALFIGSVCMAHSDENFIESDLFGNLGERDKAAILIVHLECLKKNFLNMNFPMEKRQPS